MRPGYYAEQTGGCIYFGGKLTEVEQAGYTFIYVYDSGRAGFPARDDSGMPLSPKISNNKVWLCNIGLLYWGPKMDVDGFVSHEAIRPFTLLGSAFIKNAYVSATSQNALSQFPGNRDDFQEQAGFQW